MTDDVTTTVDEPAPTSSGDAAAGDGTQRLMNWNTVASIVGLVFSVTTLILTILLSRVLKLQADLLAPAARMAARMDSDLNRSNAALGGWVAFGQARFIDERRQLWTDIDRSYDEFYAIAAPRVGGVQMEALGVFRAKLNELKHLQWAIEDVARSPGNEPAVYEYDERLVPIRRSILDALTENEDLAKLESLFVCSDTALREYVHDPSLGNLQDYQLQARKTGAAAETLRGRGHAKSVTRFVSQEYGAYEALARDIVWAQRHRDATVAQALFRRRAEPLTAAVTARMRFILTVQEQLSVRTGRMFRVLGLSVVAGALLLGIVSASTLHVSLRIRRRVNRVLARAKKLGQYAIEKRLGGGGMGEVYLARHAMLRRPAAIKLLRAESRGSRHAREKFRNEVQLTCRLTHPNTVEIFDYGVTPDGTFYYAMEFLDGATLQQIVKVTGPMPSARVIHILRQVAGSLHEAHELGLLHRDIKPANIMLCTRGGITDTAKVLDFGLVRELGDDEAAAGAKDNRAARLEGTPEYIAPESILEETGSEVRSDLYGIGAVGYFLLTGSPPFSADDVVELLCQHLADAPVPPSQRAPQGIDPTLEKIILDCLEKDPERRPASARQLRERLDHCEASRAWTERASDAWWAEFGEAIVSSVEGGEQEGLGASLRSGVAVRMDPGESNSNVT